jgi:hypothetical protein
LFLRHRFRHKFGHLYFPSQERLASPINVHLERLQLNQSEGSKTIEQWYRRYLRVGWESKFPSLIDLQDWLGVKSHVPQA